MNLTISKERVLEAANKCANAKEILKTLFPEVFEEDLSVEVPDGKIGSLGDTLFIERVNGGEYKGKAFFLPSHFNWEIKKDSQNCLCLIPTRKK